jgi:RNA recognition motif-containing protein
MKRLYVGNLAPDTTAADVEDAFSQFGRVLSVTLAADRQSGRHRAFGYVEMEDGESAAIAGLNRKDLRGQPLTVCGAIPKAATITGASGAAAEPVRRTSIR